MNISTRSFCTGKEKKKEQFESIYGIHISIFNTKTRSIQGEGSLEQVLYARHTKGIRRELPIQIYERLINNTTL